MDLFKKYNLKRTKAREIILDALVELNRPISSEALYDYLSKNNSINLATVYRNLNILSELKIINKIVRQDGIAYYSMKNIHSHFMVCDKCEQQIELEHCPMNKEYIEEVTRSSFIPTGHIFEIHGICKECQEKIKNLKDGD